MSDFEFIPGENFNDSRMWSATEQMRQQLESQLASVQAIADGAVSTAAAPSVSYTPTTAGDWTSGTPTTVQEALDLIAANLGPV